MRKLVTILGFVALSFMLMPHVLASTTVQWTGNGSDNLPCEAGGHWVLSPAQGITSATLTVNGTTYMMHQNGKGSFAADSVGALDANTTAWATYEGNDDKAFLKLSHCTQGGTPSSTPTPSPSESSTPPPSSSSPPTTTSTSASTVTSSTISTTSHSGTQPDSTQDPTPTSSLANTGNSTIPLKILGAMTLLGLTASILARRKSA